MRTIAASGVGSYRINDQEVTWEAYDKRLKDIGVLTKARNFLVFQVPAPPCLLHALPSRDACWPSPSSLHNSLTHSLVLGQGDVESVASKSPKELTTLIEQISGAEDYREKYEELRKLKDEAEENTIFSLQKKKGYAAEKKQVREQKEEAERFNGKLEELKVQQQEYYLFQLFNVHQEMSGHQEKIDALEEAKEETQAREATAEDRLRTAKKAHGKLNHLLVAAEKVKRPHC
jgi:structural maintenance of chromosome 1